jgi:hypothetical protein
VFVLLNKEQLIGEAMDSTESYWNKYYGSLVGATVLKFNGMVQDEGEWGDGFPTYTVRFADGEIGEIQISKDPEGNGGGFLFGLVLPQAVKA